MKHSELTKQKIRLARAPQGKATTDEIIDRIKNTMSLMQAEILANNGIYPHNAGNLTQKEIADRVGIDKGTIHKAGYKDVLKIINDWLKNPSGQNQEIFSEDPDKIGTPQAARSSKRKTLQERIAFYKVQAEKLQNAQVIAKLETQDARAELDVALQRLDEYELEVNRLKALLRDLGGEKIIDMHARK